MTHQLLVYSRTDGFRHDSIPTAIDTIRGFGYNATFSEDPGLFSTPTSLARFSAILFLSTSGEGALTPDGRGNLEVWLSHGGGLIGIHSATTTLVNTAFFGNAIGASFMRHPECQNATFIVTNHQHPSTMNLPTRWSFSEEVYNFNSDPRMTNASVLMTVDEDSYQDPFKPIPHQHPQGDVHPIAWYRDGRAVRRANTASPWTRISNETSWDTSGMFRPPGRMWYTALGHRNETWRDETFQDHVRGGIDWVLGVNTTRNAGGKAATGTGGGIGAAGSASGRTNGSAIADDGSGENQDSDNPSSAAAKARSSIAKLHGGGLAQYAILGLLILPFVLHAAMVL